MWWGWKITKSSFIFHLTCWLLCGYADVDEQNLKSREWINHISRVGLPVKQFVCRIKFQSSISRHSIDWKIETFLKLSVVNVQHGVSSWTLSISIFISSFIIITIIAISCVLSCWVNEIEKKTLISICGLFFFFWTTKHTYAKMRNAELQSVPQPSLSSQPSNMEIVCWCTQNNQRMPDPTEPRRHHRVDRQ